jgi:hypothetical protein
VLPLTNSSNDDRRLSNTLSTASTPRQEWSHSFFLRPFITGAAVSQTTKITISFTCRLQSIRTLGVCAECGLEGTTRSRTSCVMNLCLWTRISSQMLPSTLGHKFRGTLLQSIAPPLERHKLVGTVLGVRALRSQTRITQPTRICQHFAARRCSRRRTSRCIFD